MNSQPISYFSNKNCMYMDYMGREKVKWQKSLKLKLE